MDDYGRQLANAGLEIGAIKLQPEKPFLWASGFYMPIYNDNRMFLGNSEHRQLVTEGLWDRLDELDFIPDLIAGTSTSGIAPAASLAQVLEMPLVIQHEGRAYVFDMRLLGELSVEKHLTDDTQIVVSTCPFAIPPAVLAANNHRLPFAYVRAEKKDHGKKQQVEGIVKEGQKALLVDYSLNNESYYGIAAQAMEDLGLKISCFNMEDITSRLKPADIRGKSIVQIEDLVSTGGSSVKEIETYRQLGARASHCIAIFSYQLEKALDIFRNADVSLSSVLTYDVLLEQALSKGKISADDNKVLAEWRTDPFNWGERHGFPPKKK
jgi:orotate phosphoribosyltransferase